MPSDNNDLVQCPECPKKVHRPFLLGHRKTHPEVSLRWKDYIADSTDKLYRLEMSNTERR